MPRCLRLLPRAKWPLLAAVAAVAAMLPVEAAPSVLAGVARPLKGGGARSTSSPENKSGNHASGNAAATVAALLVGGIGGMFDQQSKALPGVVKPSPERPDSTGRAAVSGRGEGSAPGKGWASTEPGVVEVAPPWDWAHFAWDAQSTLLKLIPPLSSQLLALAPMVDVQRIKQQGSSGNMSPISYVAMMTTIWLSSLLTLILGGYYLSVLARYSSTSPRLYMLAGLAVTCSVVGGALMLPVADAVELTGEVGALITVIWS
ncbi:hypothetical protein T484DRAFT_1807581 [Baffinella frigidus]|nr:hypothetical protein T484DRAFT_1807581 [Cryptophyta sp. CCMP2293]